MVNERILALLELSNDIFYHKIPAGRLSYYIDTPLAIGREVAAQYAGQDIFALYSAQGIAIDYRPETSSKYGVTLRGQAVMSKAECRVELYESSIRTLSGHSAFDDLPAPDYEAALRIHLAHEFFHFWEYKNGRSVSDEMDSVATIRVLGFARHAKISRCGEIAAHAFAKELLGLPCLPNLYDYSYLLAEGKLTRESFQQKIRTAEELLA